MALREDLDAAVERMTRLAREPLPFEPDFRPIAPIPDRRDAPLQAVDGSHAVLLDTGGLWVVAYRAAVWPRAPGPIEPRVVAATPGEAHDCVRADAAQHGLPEPPRPRSAEHFAELLRAMAELEAGLAAPPGLLLWDGALHLPDEADSFARALAGLAAERGPCLGVVKRSRIHGGLTGRLLEKGHQRRLEAAWHVALPEHDDLHIVLLAPGAPQAFRIDGPADHLPAVAAWSTDAIYRGYPYPLAMAHNAVALTTGDVAELRGRLDVAARGAGVARWVREEFHGVLDDNVA
ncbi:MAG: DNA double-strand break repair nuclease NurA [Thermoplasmatota archaeon]